jgi:hypothetical protein
MNAEQTAFETTITCSVAQADRIHDQVLPALASYLQLAEPAYALHVQIRLTVRTSDQRLTQALRALALEDRADPIAELREHLERELTRQDKSEPILDVLPCQKCRMHPSVIHPDSALWSVDCLYCGTQTESTYPIRNEAIAAWNRDHGIPWAEPTEPEEVKTYDPAATLEPDPAFEQGSITASVPTPEPIQENPILSEQTTPIVLPCQNYSQGSTGLVSAGSEKAAKCPNCGFMFIRRRKDQEHCMKPECRKAAAKKAGEKWRTEHGKVKKAEVQPPDEMDAIRNAYDV